MSNEGPTQGLQSVFVSMDAAIWPYRVHQRFGLRRFFDSEAALALVE